MRLCKFVLAVLSFHLAAVAHAGDCRTSDTFQDPAIKSCSENFLRARALQERIRAANGQLSQVMNTRLSFNAGGANACQAAQGRMQGNLDGATQSLRGSHTTIRSLEQELVRYQTALSEGKSRLGQMKQVITWLNRDCVPHIQSCPNGPGPIVTHEGNSGRTGCHMLHECQEDGRFVGYRRLFGSDAVQQLQQSSVAKLQQQNQKVEDATKEHVDALTWTETQHQYLQASARGAEQGIQSTQGASAQVAALGDNCAALGTLAEDFNSRMSGEAQALRSSGGGPSGGPSGAAGAAVPGSNPEPRAAEPPTAARVEGGGGGPPRGGGVAPGPRPVDAPDPLAGAAPGPRTVDAPDPLAGAAPGPRPDDAPDPLGGAAPGPSPEPGPLAEPLGGSRSAAAATGAPLILGGDEDGPPSPENSGARSIGRSVNDAPPVVAGGLLPSPPPPPEVPTIRAPAEPAPVVAPVLDASQANIASPGPLAPVPPPIDGDLGSIATPAPVAPLPPIPDVPGSVVSASPPAALPPPPPAPPANLIIAAASEGGAPAAMPPSTTAAPPAAQSAPTPEEQALIDQLRRPAAVQGEPGPGQ